MTWQPEGGVGGGDRRSLSFGFQVVRDVLTLAPMKRILRTTLAAMGLLAVSLFGLTGCKGPERAPRQPVSGVDSPPLHETGSRPSK